MFTKTSTPKASAINFLQHLVFLVLVNTNHYVCHIYHYIHVYWEQALYKLLCHIPILDVVGGPIPRTLTADTSTVTIESALMVQDDIVTLSSP